VDEPYAAAPGRLKGFGFIFKGDENCAGLHPFREG